jgi:leucyl aminopeptidase
MLAISYLATVAEPVAALAVFAGPDGALSAGAKAADAAANGAVQSAVKAARFEGGVGEIVELLAPAGLFRSLMAEVERRAGPTMLRDLAHPATR